MAMLTNFRLSAPVVGSVPVVMIVVAGATVETVVVVWAMTVIEATNVVATFASLVPASSRCGPPARSQQAR